MMQSKLKIGIVFGGTSREREISFAGGRTVYDNLDKSLFEPIPFFIDSFGHIIELEWRFVYKGTIRDFYPPLEATPQGSTHQFYAEQLGPLTVSEQLALHKGLGTSLSWHEWAQRIDFAFLCLHGQNGEDGRIQGLLEFLKIPYSGSGIFSSALGMNKAIQKEWMQINGFETPTWMSLQRQHWLQEPEACLLKLQHEMVFPCVIKPANQGSSIGVSILQTFDATSLRAALDKAFFISRLSAETWKAMTPEQRLQYAKALADIRESIGMPLQISGTGLSEPQICYHPEAFVAFANSQLQSGNWLLESLDSEQCVLAEGFIEGREFSCIVIEDANGRPIALPPTEIRKGKELFDYRSKYLPGLSRKITPIDLPRPDLDRIAAACTRLFSVLHTDVYARIDGFMGIDGRVYLNDPNTTSGMMPSSFFFHQAAEIGLTPAQFLNFIIRTSLLKRLHLNDALPHYQKVLNRLDALFTQARASQHHKIKVAVILGGYSSERHISVESGRNVFEKLASSERYMPIPVFLNGNAEHFSLYHIPIHLLLKDNADDISEKLHQTTVHPFVENVRNACAEIILKFGSSQNLWFAKPLPWNTLNTICDFAFIALHGRPGEDGALQQQLEALNIPYNGSGPQSAALTINKFKTNALLREQGFTVARHRCIQKTEWMEHPQALTDAIEHEFGFPCIAKPLDDGCSSAVKKIHTTQELAAFCKLLFRDTVPLDEQAAALLHIKPKEEFPQKTQLLVEELIQSADADYFLEITGGLLTRIDTTGQLHYEVFEASEALADGAILSLEEKFLAGQGQNITPARYAPDATLRQSLSNQVKLVFQAVAETLNVTGYCRIDAFVRVYLAAARAEVIIIEINSLPGMTPATCIFHQAALQQYKPLEFIDHILQFGMQHKKHRPK